MVLCDIVDLHLCPKTKETGSEKFVKDTQFSQIFWEKRTGNLQQNETETF
jgi:hypothetical protein